MILTVETYKRGTTKPKLLRTSHVEMPDPEPDPTVEAIKRLESRIAALERR